MLKIRSIILVIVFFLAYTLARTEVLQVGEELEYEVSYIGIKLGTIKIYTERMESLNGKTVYKIKGLMDSYPNIPFVDLHAVFDSWLDQTVAYSHKFVGSVKADADNWDYSKMIFDYKKPELSVEKWSKKQLVQEAHYKTTKKFSDGLSLFFIARKFIIAKRPILVPTIIDIDTVSTSINFHGKTENVEIDAVDYPVRTRYFSGSADWTGIYGMTGKFEGWFSDDDASVPIRAKMKVYIGNVSIMLTKWKRANWAPPKAN